MTPLLPHIFTTLNLFAGFFAIIASFEGRFYQAGVAILLAIVFDVFDGRIARLIGQMSKFGKEFDSLADMVSFGIAPAVLIYNFSLRGFSRMGWLACFLYAACVALRLARFNVKSSSTLYFEGLPSPAGGAIISATVLLLLNLGVELFYRNWLLLIMVYLLAYLFISPIKYPAFKEIKIKSAQTFYFLVLFLLMLTLTAANPPLLLFVFVAFYILIGPFVLFGRYGSRFFKKIFKRGQKT
ncbi:CDP-diacylglycerol--serine O-phosphatidyltransferase [Caldimicrobium thiodismutans]|uniref:CDP-diacylglycerol--serine O-phosphatidyltransferase n=1 Tax=Caldimicrobium thiodismutans TaxID=1653476 RepID=A0A0U5AW06_9BACT|nr:CDP-diacylglycerol--serine O-phosphatidyltransferase [Caldimicrobium thiodismutans]BAU22734.1 CDP-diacylglycerol--serine O-phosphatidyltransferase [Caldimicrobium thiodismutans]